MLHACLLLCPLPCHAGDLDFDVNKLSLRRDNDILERAVDQLAALQTGRGKGDVPLGWQLPLRLQIVCSRSVQGCRRADAALPEEWPSAPGQPQQWRPQEEATYAHCSAAPCHFAAVCASLPGFGQFVKKNFNKGSKGKGKGAPATWDPYMAPQKKQRGNVPAVDDQINQFRAAFKR